MSSELSTRQDNGSAMSIATSRQAQEVQAAMIIAKNFPRDEIQAIEKIKRSCQRPGLAECSMYAYSKGGSKIEGPSIRLAEALAQGWGNIEYGIIELSQKPGESSVMAYAWDLETNTRRQMVFQVPHVRRTRESSTVLTDPRDVYELVANQGARRVRACILGVIPGDVQDLAVAECEKTLSNGGTVPLADRIRNMVLAFGELGVTKAMLEERLTHPVEACSAGNVNALQKIYLSIRDGISSREEWFNVGGSGAADKPADGAKQSRADATKAKMAKQQKPTEPEKPQEQPSEPVPVTDTAIAAAGTVESLDAMQAQLKAEREAMQQDEFDYLNNLINARRKQVLGK